MADVIVMICDDDDLEDAMAGDADGLGAVGVNDCPILYDDDLSDLDAAFDAASDASMAASDDEEAPTEQPLNTSSLAA